MVGHGRCPCAEGHANWRLRSQKALGREVRLLNNSEHLNPIEQAFAKLKHLLRKAAARTREAACETIGALLDSFAAAECANYFKNSGMVPPKAIPL